MADKEYIEKQAAIDEIESLSVTVTGLRGGKNLLTRYAKCYKDGVVKVLSEAHAADVVEVRRGGWIIATNYKTPVSHAYIRKEKLYICPYCTEGYRQHMNFCGNCGAKMDGGKHG